MPPNKHFQILDTKNCASPRLSNTRATDRLADVVAVLSYVVYARPCKQVKRECQKKIAKHATCSVYSKGREKSIRAAAMKTEISRETLQVFRYFRYGRVRYLSSAQEYCMDCSQMCKSTPFSSATVRSVDPGHLDKNVEKSKPNTKLQNLDRRCETGFEIPTASSGAALRPKTKPSLRGLQARNQEMNPPGRPFVSRNNCPFASFPHSLLSTTEEKGSKK